MRRHLIMIARVAVMLFIASSLSGCQMVRKKFGIVTEVQDPAEDSPEWVVQQVMEAAMIEDDDKAWRAMRKHLHSKIKSSKADMKNWKSMYFPKNTRLKVRKGLFFENDNKPIWKFAYKEETVDDRLRIFVYNEGNPDLPTPCMLAIDAKNNDEWRVIDQCL